MRDGRHDLITQGWNKPDTYRHSSTSALKSQDYYSFFQSRYGFGVLSSLKITIVSFRVDMALVCYLHGCRCIPELVDF